MNSKNITHNAFISQPFYGISNTFTSSPTTVWDSHSSNTYLTSTSSKRTHTKPLFFPSNRNSIQQQNSYHNSQSPMASAASASTSSPSSTKFTHFSILGSGCSTPDQVVTNDDLQAIVETSDEWIRTRTGIGNRCLVKPPPAQHQEDGNTHTNNSLSRLAAQAASNALDMAKVDPTQIDMIILCTSTPDDLFGSAAFVQALIGASNAVAFDLTAACSGFIFGLATASQFLRSGTYKNVLVIGADVLSRWVDWNDRTTCVLFGDGAGAVVVHANHPDSSSSNMDIANSLLAFELHSDGSQNSSLNLGFHPQIKTLGEQKAHIEQGTYMPVTMSGRDVYRFACSKVPQVLESALAKAHLTPDNIDWLILHQANQRIMDAVAQRLNIPASKVISNLEFYGNTSAASIPIALDEAVRSGKIKHGDVIASAGFGAGLSWGAAIFRWGF